MDTMTYESLPAVFHEADRASQNAQRKYLLLVKCELLLMITAAALSAFAFGGDVVRQNINVAIAGVFVIGIVLTKLIIDSKYDKAWFSARALAESIKENAWLYATGSRGYPSSMSDAEADREFCRNIGLLLNDAEPVALELSPLDPCGDVITEAMRRLRRADIAARKDVYLRDRIYEQRTWYSNKARMNAKAAKRWLVIVAALQAGGAIAAVLMATSVQIPFDIASVVAAMAMAALAWLPVKQHQTLAASYALTAHNLALLATDAIHATTEQDFSVLVEGAEQIISKEHSKWAARQKPS